MGTVLNNLFGKGKGSFGDVEYWHGAERAGWLMKQGKVANQHYRISCYDSICPYQLSDGTRCGDIAYAVVSRLL